jgi:transportin-3
MATNGLGNPAAFAPSEVLEAMMTMRSSDSIRKKKAHEYLEEFQKSVRLDLPRGSRRRNR